MDISQKLTFYEHYLNFRMLYQSSPWLFTILFLLVGGTIGFAIGYTVDRSITNYTIFATGLWILATVLFILIFFIL